MSESLRLVVAGRRDLTSTICQFVLRAAEGGVLPSYEVGSHITVTTPSGLKRSYSLTQPSGPKPVEYSICVRRDPLGAGGSLSLHDSAVTGSLLTAAPPRNAFPLVPSKRYLFIAGGIGITPIRAMVCHLRAQGHDGVRLLYLTRNAEDTPFRTEFDQAGDLVHHSDDQGFLDLWQYLAEPDDDMRVYCCGPESLMRLVRAMTAHWRESRIHFEDFAEPAMAVMNGTPFTAIWEPTGQRVEVPAHRSLLDSLRRQGIRVDSSCGSGTCGTCLLGVVSGDPQHHDRVLSDEAKRGHILPCVSRATSPVLELRPAAT